MHSLCYDQRPHRTIRSHVLGHPHTPSPYSIFTFLLSSILFMMRSLYLFTLIVYIYCVPDVCMSSFALTHPSSPITASLSLALDCRSLHLSLYDPAPGSSTQPLLTQPSLSPTIVPAWPHSPPKPSAQTQPLHSGLFVSTSFVWVHIVKGDTEKCTWLSIPASSILSSLNWPDLSIWATKWQMQGRSSLIIP